MPLWIVYYILGLFNYASFFYHELEIQELSWILYTD